MKYPCLSNHLQEISEKKPEISDYDNIKEITEIKI